jgi:hypothetical protein
MFQRDRERRLRRDDSDRREERHENQQIEKHEQSDGDREALPPPARRVMEYLPFAHHPPFQAQSVRERQPAVAQTGRAAGFGPCSASSQVYTSKQLRDDGPRMNPRSFAPGTSPARPLTQKGPPQRDGPFLFFEAESLA